MIEEQAALGATHFSIITYADLTSATNTQTLAGLISQKANVMSLRVVSAVVVTPFVSSDATLVSTAFIIGDANSTNRYLTSLETNAANGTPPVAGQTVVGALSEATSYIASVAITADAVITGTAGKVLSTHTAGVLFTFWQVQDSTFIS